MIWGIVVEWDERGLTCRGWMQRTDKNTVDDPMEFDAEADAAHFISELPECPYDRTLAPQELDEHLVEVGPLSPTPTQTILQEIARWREQYAAVKHNGCHIGAVTSLSQGIRDFVTQLRDELNDPARTWARDDRARIYAALLGGLRTDFDEMLAAMEKAGVVES